MAKFAELNDSFYKWLETRPQTIKDMIKRFPPNLLYMMKSTGNRVTIVAYNEDGTVTVNVSPEYNLIFSPRNVFGVNLNDLKECDFPNETELLGLISD